MSAGACASLGYLRRLEANAALGAAARVHLVQHEPGERFALCGKRTLVNLPAPPATPTCPACLEAGARLRHMEELDELPF